jgi:hypothetical protein
MPSSGALSLRLTPILGSAEVLPVIAGRRIGADGSFQDGGHGSALMPATSFAMIAGSITAIKQRLTELGVEHDQ